MKFTGERFIVGQAVGDIVIEHMQRYRMAAVLAGGKDVLDAACGEGYGSSILSGQARSVTGIDISAQAVSYAEEHYARENLHYICASVTELPLADDSVDMVVSFETLEHIDAAMQRQFLAEIRRVLRSGGFLLMSSPDKKVYSDLRNFQNPYHVHELYTDEFDALLADYFPERCLFSQGIGDQRVGVIEPVEGQVRDTHLVNEFLLDPMDKQYVLALCSDMPLEQAAADSLVSVMPFVPESPVRVFVDDGGGFSEEKVIVGAVKSLGEDLLQAVFSLGRDWPTVRRLRFDPVEKSGCYCCIEELRGASQMESRALNAYDRKGAWDRFLTGDPQYIIEGALHGAETVTVVYRFRPIALDDLWRLLCDEMAARTLDLQGKIHAGEQALTAERAAKEAEQEAHLRDIRIHEERIRELMAERDAREDCLQQIYHSRGYRVLCQYYSLRDWLLPKHSRRRLFLKNTVWGVLHLRCLWSLINRENLGKVWTSLHQGGLGLMLSKLDHKLHGAAVQALPQGDVPWGNGWLAESRPVVVPADMVFDIVVPIYNAYDFTRRCLASVYRNTSIPYNLYLIDDCSPDERISQLLDTLENQPWPEMLRELHIMRNKENLGFIASVNKGLQAGKNHVVLLNTDTEVPSGWLERLAAPMLQDGKTASVTPFSNSATICSFPVFCENNDLPEGLTADDVDALFHCYGGGRPIEIPTGVGFCMLLNRECLSACGFFDMRYGKGYGEENDWCCRVAAAGFRNIMATDLFVYHKHGVSFAEQKDKSKDVRIQENLRLLAERYPDYTARVERFIAANPLRGQRNFLACICKARSDSRTQGVLFINHSLGGGAKVYQDRLFREWSAEKRCYTLEILPDHHSLLLSCSVAQEEKFYFDLNSLTSDEFHRLNEALGITEIYVNQLVTFPAEKMMQFIKDTGVPYVFFFHDYYAVCPGYTLVDSSGKYCQAEKNPAVCNACLQGLQSAETDDIQHWRDCFHTFLQGAAQLIAPSQVTADIIKSYYPDLPVLVREHAVPAHIHRTYENEFAMDPVLKVGILGAIGINKGSKIVRSLVQGIRQRNLPVQIIVIGITDWQNDPFVSDDDVLEITGAYDGVQVSDLLAAKRVSLVMIPSIWPETYSYTTSEAVHSGYPVLVFSMGAPAERVHRDTCGWTVDEVSSEALLDKLEELAMHRNEVISAAERIF